MSSKFKVGIAIPLRARSTTHAWDKVCSNLERTLRSLMNQSKADFIATVVGHDCPDFMLNEDSELGKKVRFTQFTDVPPPTQEGDVATHYYNYEYDRCRKILRGMILLKGICEVSHWYALDADDLVHPSFVSVIIDRGYSYYEDADIIHREDEFSAYCGSCTIIPARHVQLPDLVSMDNFRETWFGAISHKRMRSTLQDRGMNIATPVERLAMYMRNHGTNLSDMRKSESLWSSTKFMIKTLVKRPPMLSAVRRDFRL